MISAAARLITDAAADTAMPSPICSSGRGWNKRSTAAMPMPTAAAKISDPSKKLEKYSAFPCPYRWPSSAGRDATVSIKSAITAPTTFTSDSIASDMKPTDPVSTYAADLSAIVTTAAAMESHAKRTSDLRGMTNRAATAGASRPRRLQPRPRVRRGQTTQAHQPDHVGKHLERVHQIAPGPDDVRLEHGAERNEQAVDPSIRQRHAAAENVLEELLPVVRPADERGVAEQKRAERDGPPAEGRDRGVERVRDRGRAGDEGPAGVFRGDRLLGDAAHEDRHRADRRRDERDDERFHDRLQALLSRLRGPRGAVGDGRGAVAGFVRVDAAGDAVAHREEHPEAHRRARGERLVHDHRQHVRQPIRERDDHRQAAEDVQRDFQRRELLGRAPDRLDAADDDRPREH